MKHSTRPVYTTHAYGGADRTALHRDRLRRGRPGMSLYTATLLQVLAALLLLWLTRFCFYACNLDLTGLMSVRQLTRAALGGLRFDLAAAAWFNAPFILMRLMPFGWARSKGWTVAGNIVYSVCNSAMLLLNVADTAYFRYSGARMQWDTLKAVWGDGGMGGIMAGYMREFWWAYLLGALCVCAVCLAAWLPRIRPSRPWPAWGRWLLLIAAAGLCFLCIRGRVTQGRPLSAGDAVWYAEQPPHVNTVLNTPFSVVRSAGSRSGRVETMDFFSDEELGAVRRSVHMPDTSRSFTRRNVVVLVLESGGTVWLDSQRAFPADDGHRHLMPTLDSIAQRSLSVRHAFASGRMSVGGLTAIFCGFPIFGTTPYPATPYVGNRTDAPAYLLRSQGYSTKFWFGGHKGSFGIPQLLGAAGFGEVTDMSDFDVAAGETNSWGVYDHVLGPRMARELNDLPQPFIAGWFMLNPHSPWQVPQGWGAPYASPPATLEETVEYTDRALKAFFDEASRQPWYRDALFVIVGDHGCRDLKGSPFDTDWLQPHITLLFHTPDGSVEPRVAEETVASQFDIAPTLLHMLGYPEPFVAVGRDIWDGGPAYALNCLDGAYRIMGTRYMAVMDTEMKKVTAVYETAVDPVLEHNLLPRPAEPENLERTAPGEFDADEIRRMAVFGRAFMQDYTHRLNENRMSCRRQ